MNRAAKVVAALVVATLLAMGWWAFDQLPREPGTVPTTPASQPAATAPSGVEPAPIESVSSLPTTTPTRTEAGPGSRTGPTAPSYAQGFRGLVVGIDQRPLGGLPVYLVDSAGNEPLAMPMLRQQRDAFGPVASTETASDGTFALGLPVAQDRIYELYVLSPTHATSRLGGLRLLAGQWHALDTITMTPGASLRGRVTVAGRDDTPVPGTTITVEVGAVFADAALRALPGAGVGLVATTDSAGRYELKHVPSRGVVQVVALASGFACLRKPNIELRLDVPVDVDFALLPGQSLAGATVDGRGAGIANARVEAWPQQTSGEPLVGHSDASGRFEVLGLSPGKHRLRVVAHGFETADESNVEPGRSDLRLVLQEQSRVRVRVVSPRGDTLRSYQLGLRRTFPDQGNQIAAVADVPEQRVRLDGLTDFAELRCVPVGLFRCQVEAEGFAKTLSEKIDNTRMPGAPLGPREFEVVVTMTSGASLRGRVVDEIGAPIAGATVSTQAAGTVPDSPFFRMLSGTVPDKITAVRTTTAADGSFVLTMLALADYQLLVEHEAACRTTVPDLQLDRVGEQVVPPITMVTGASITGRATVAGRVAGQVKVVLTTPPALANARDALRLETVTDAAGNFRMPRRVPPGTYDLRAAVVGTAEPEAQIFRQLLQLQRSAITFTVTPGQRQVERDIDLPSEN